MNTLSRNKLLLSLPQQRLLALRLATLGDKQCGRDLKMSLTGGLLVSAGLMLGALLTSETHEKAPSLRSSLELGVPVGAVERVVVPGVAGVQHAVVTVADVPVVEIVGIRDVVGAMEDSPVSEVPRQVSASAVEVPVLSGFTRDVAQLVGDVAGPEGRDSFVGAI